jgi:hypothetical protein
MLLRHPLNQAVHTCHELPRQGAVSCSRVCPVFQFLKIKDLTCNAQFNFCLLTSIPPGLPRWMLLSLSTVPSLFVPRPPRPGLEGLSTAAEKSCDKLQNQTFKDHFPHAPPGDKKTQSRRRQQIVAPAIAGQHAFSRRDKIELLNLKSQKLEEPSAFDRNRYRLLSAAHSLAGRTL